MDETNAPRRADRAVEDEAWIRGFLRRAPVGTLALVRDGRPYANPNIFVHDDAARAIYVHTARDGRMPRSSAEGADGVFAAFTMGRILPARRAIGFSVEYESVLCFGRVDLVEDEDEAYRVLDLLMEKYAPHLERGKDFEPATPADLAQTAVHRLRVDAWSAKRNAKPEDFPGAYRYGERPAARAAPPDVDVP